MGERNYMKSIVTFNNSINTLLACANANNNDKCKIMNLCTNYNDKYHKQKYLSVIDSPEIRSIITKLRIDMNCMWDSKK